MSEPLPPPVPMQRLAGLPVSHLLSFLNHDICGPTSMLRTYIRAIADGAESGEVRDQLSDAENLTAQVEWMLRLLRTMLALSDGSLELHAQPVPLASLLFRFALANDSVHRNDEVSLDEDLRVVVDERLLALALEGAAWQMGRMGARQGPMSVGVRAVSADRVEIALCRADLPLDGDLVVRACEGRDEDWTTFLRRLPACGFPLRVARLLVGAMGGESWTLRETGTVVLALPR